jgi:PEP-CTERM motif
MSGLIFYMGSWGAARLPRATDNHYLAAPNSSCERPASRADFFAPRRPRVVQRGGTVLAPSGYCEDRPVGFHAVRGFVPGLYSERLVEVAGIAPDWLRVGTDITGQGPFNAAFSLRGSPVPEPSTWAMMLLGFAGLSFAGYRRARKGGRASA